MVSAAGCKLLVVVNNEMLNVPTTVIEERLWAQILMSLAMCLLWMGTTPHCSLTIQIADFEFD